MAFAVADSRYDAPQPVLEVGYLRVIEDEPGRSEREPEGEPEERNSYNPRCYRRPLNDFLATSSPELIPVTPRSELGSLRLANPDQLEAFVQTCQPDLISRDAKLRPSVRPLAFLDRLPALFDRRKVPTRAFPAHNPQPSLRGVERESAPDREMLDGFVRAELGMTEKAR
jgi:hypothetical protein